jgi:Protein of unknown function (DUF1573).
MKYRVSGDKGLFPDKQLRLNRISAARGPIWGVVLIMLLALWAPADPAWAQQVTVTKVPEGESPTALPRLILEQPVYEGGEIEAGTTITHEFTIKNEGRAPLVISEVRAGCGCIVSDFDRDIAPGESGQVSITMKIYQEWAGHSLRRTAWIINNDPISPQVRLTMNVRVKPGPEPAPDGKP